MHEVAFSSFPQFPLSVSYNLGSVKTNLES